ncbi:hypothetical protein K493DRAFT_318152 [Basidiobolus meristosporus CBS 931.73]|uniref:Ribosomal protein/NADH dehydrogenase domain-containing protein n=1 Tax=Basidiobolus meristosporus CBS 931.73 TaxID=1314790 RepID=A0A1Y1XWW0_9FUNG|nr:hypothetical protein K493DRAFT_318152 [Basidiobolus meristosporus CBS 931.73]|eukprot:ORX90155.1 hypothetical protein K493DRAFT_318152 [Basidiobolus meristosporus CBS 931.73]
MRILPNAQKLVNRLKFGVGATKINSDIRKLTFEYRSRDPAPTVRFLQKALPRLQFHNPGVTFEIIKHNPVKFKPIRERKPREEQNAAAEAEKPVTEAVEQTTAVAVEQPKAEVSEQVAKKVAESAASKPAKAPNAPAEKKVRPTLIVEFANAKSVTWKLKNIHSKSIVEKLTNATSSNRNPKVEQVHKKVKNEVEL